MTKWDLQERTSGGYTKWETQDGNIRYRRPDGAPAKQQGFAGSKGGKATAERYDTRIETDESGNIVGSRKVRKDTTLPQREAIGFVKGHYDGGKPSESFEFKIRIDGVSGMGRSGIRDRMEDSLSDSLDFARTQIAALEKATIDVSPTDDAAIDIDRTRKSAQPFSGQFEILFENGSWWGYGIPEKELSFANTTPTSRKISRANRTLR